MQSSIFRVVESPFDDGEKHGDDDARFKRLAESDEENWYMR